MSNKALQAYSQDCSFNISKCNANLVVAQSQGQLTLCTLKTH